MNKKTVLSDNFISQKSLYDSPVTFQKNLASGCVFYLGIDAKNSGDFLIMHDDSCLTISLVGDVEGHGVNAKSRLETIRPYITNIVESASQFDKRAISDSLFVLDKHLDEYLVALSFVKIMDSNKIQYLNIGENKMFFIHNGEVIDKSISPGGKMGLFKLLSQDPSKIIEELTPIETEIATNDRIFMCTDGVKEYLRAGKPCSTVPYIVKTIGSDLSLETIVKKINLNMAKKLKSIKSELQDDYTMVFMEFHNP